MDIRSPCFEWSEDGLVVRPNSATALRHLITKYIKSFSVSHFALEHSLDVLFSKLDNAKDDVELRAVLLSLLSWHEANHGATPFPRLLYQFISDVRISAYHEYFQNEYIKRLTLYFSSAPAGKSLDKKNALNEASYIVEKMPLAMRVRMLETHVLIVNPKMKNPDNFIKWAFIVAATMTADLVRENYARLILIAKAYLIKGNAIVRNEVCKFLCRYVYLISQHDKQEIYRYLLLSINAYSDKQLRLISMLWRDIDDVEQQELPKYIMRLLKSKTKTTLYLIWDCLPNYSQEEILAFIKIQCDLYSDRYCIEMIADLLVNIDVREISPTAQSMIKGMLYSSFDTVNASTEWYQMAANAVSLNNTTENVLLADRFSHKLFSIDNVSDPYRAAAAFGYLNVCGQFNPKLRKIYIDALVERIDDPVKKIADSSIAILVEMLGELPALAEREYVLSHLISKINHTLRELCCYLQSGAKLGFSIKTTKNLCILLINQLFVQHQTFPYVMSSIEVLMKELTFSADKAEVLAHIFDRDIKNDRYLSCLLAQLEDYLTVAQRRYVIRNLIEQYLDPHNQAWDYQCDAGSALMRLIKHLETSQILHLLTTLFSMRAILHVYDQGNELYHALYEQLGVRLLMQPNPSSYFFKLPKDVKELVSDYVMDVSRCGIKRRPLG